MPSMHSYLNPASPPATSPPSYHSNSPAQHMSSTTLSSSPGTSRVATKRTSQHLRTDKDIRLGSLSPTSIPSSPTSIHSSSSAIFERDIEPLSLPSPHITQRRGRVDQVEHVVPSVLDTAASVLVSERKVDERVVVVGDAFNILANLSISAGGVSLGSSAGSLCGSRAPSIRSGRGKGSQRDSVAIDDVGGEWEREGLGMGLEERLEMEVVGTLSLVGVSH